MKAILINNEDLQAWKDQIDNAIENETNLELDSGLDDDGHGPIIPPPPPPVPPV